MWKEDMLSEEQMKRKKIIKMQGIMEEMTYWGEGGRDATDIFEPTDKYHGNDDHGNDSNDEDEGNTKFK